MTLTKYLGPTLCVDKPGMKRRRRLAFLSLTALGVVYGDIGTSPLYALRECFFGAYAIPVTGPHVLGVLSLITWSLVNETRVAHFFNLPASPVFEIGMQISV